MILKRMKRRHSRADAIAFCEAMRALRPDIVFGADVIAGFPTEDDAAFDASLALVEECGLTHLHVFPYSPREGTPAARMPQLAPRVIAERATRLREAGAKALHGHLAAQVGRTARVLSERGDVGRTEGFALVDLPAGTPPGQLLNLRIAGVEGERLLAA
jgi:threonylcarbamoyladenosine tRNA methylthiotransferase MtaB